MTGRKKSFGIGISMLLLLCFSVTILPLDFFHNHSKTVVCSESEKTGTCHHRFHLSEKSSYCWLCAIHYDKVFTKDNAGFSFVCKTDLPVLPEGRTSSYSTELVLSTLRGPPLS